MLPSLRALVFPIAQCSTSSAQNCKRLCSYIQHNCALPDADDLALRAQNFKNADLPMPPSASRAQKPQFCAQNPRKWGSRRPKAHKNLDFVLEMPENRGSGWQKRTKTSILCSNSPKTRVSKAKSAQKPRFCARNARKRGSRRPKAHKNFDFVLEMPENEGPGGQKSTKTSILCSGRGGIGIGKLRNGIGNRKSSLPANHRARFKNANIS